MMGEKSFGKRKKKNAIDSKLSGYDIANILGLMQVNRMQKKQ